MTTRTKASSGSPFEATIGFSRAVRVGNRILVSGTATVPGATEPVKAITRLNVPKASFPESARVWIHSES